MAGGSYEGSGATLEEALWDAHSKVPQPSHSDLKRSRVDLIRLETGGFTNIPSVHVTVCAD